MKDGDNKGQAMKWNNVRDILPPFDEKVLGYSEGANRIYICFRRKEDEYNEHWAICEEQDCSCVGCTAPISHWISLPLQPERSKREDLDHQGCGALNTQETE